MRVNDGVRLAVLIAAFAGFGCVKAAFETGCSIQAGSQTDAD